MSALSDRNKTDRLTVRLPSHDLDQLRDLARARNSDVATLGREAIRAYLDGTNPQTSNAQFAHELRATVREQVDRIIDRHEQITRSLIAALNTHLTGGKSP